MKAARGAKANLPDPSGTPSKPQQQTKANFPPLSGSSSSPGHHQAVWGALMEPSGEQEPSMNLSYLASMMQTEFRELKGSLRNNKTILAAQAKHMD